MNSESHAISPIGSTINAIQRIIRRTTLRLTEWLLVAALALIELAMFLVHADVDSNYLTGWRRSADPRLSKEFRRPFFSSSPALEEQ